MLSPRALLLCALAACASALPAFPAKAPNPYLKGMTALQRQLAASTRSVHKFQNHIRPNHIGQAMPFVSEPARGRVLAETAKQQCFYEPEDKECIIDAEFLADASEGTELEESMGYAFMVMQLMCEEVTDGTHCNQWESCEWYADEKFCAVKDSAQSKLLAEFATVPNKACPTTTGTKNKGMDMVAKMLVCQGHTTKATCNADASCAYDDDENRCDVDMQTEMEESLWGTCSGPIRVMSKAGDICGKASDQKNCQAITETSCRWDTGDDSSSTNGGNHSDHSGHAHRRRLHMSDDSGPECVFNESSIKEVQTAMTSMSATLQTEMTTIMTQCGSAMFGSPSRRHLLQTMSCDEARAMTRTQTEAAMAAAGQTLSAADMDTAVNQALAMAMPACATGGATSGTPAANLSPAQCKQLVATATQTVQATGATVDQAAIDKVLQTIAPGCVGHSSTPSAPPGGSTPVAQTPTPAAAPANCDNLEAQMAGIQARAMDTLYTSLLGDCGTSNMGSFIMKSMACQQTLTQGECESATGIQNGCKWEAHGGHSMCVGDDTQLLTTAMGAGKPVSGCFASVGDEVSKVIANSMLSTSKASCDAVGGMWEVETHQGEEESWCEPSDDKLYQVMFNSPTNTPTMMQAVKDCASLTTNATCVAKTNTYSAVVPDAANKANATVAKFKSKTTLNGFTKESFTAAEQAKYKDALSIQLNVRKTKIGELTCTHPETSRRRQLRQTASAVVVEADVSSGTEAAAQALAAKYDEAASSGSLLSELNKAGVATTGVSAASPTVATKPAGAADFSAFAPAVAPPTVSAAPPAAPTAQTGTPVVPMNQKSAAPRGSAGVLFFAACGAAALLAF